MSENDFSRDDFIDISSSSGTEENKKIHIEQYAEKYGNGIFKSLGTIIKCIAFLICFTIIIGSFIAAYFVFTFDKTFLAIAAGIVVVGLIVGLINLFIIYGIGHVICQNNEILSRLNNRNR